MDGSAATGLLLRRHDGSIIFSAYQVLFHCKDALEAEIHAIMQGMALALQHSALPVWVQSDSSVALSSLVDASLSRSVYGHLVAEIKSLMEEREFIPKKITRSQNKVADCLASYSRTGSCSAVWLLGVPPCITELVPRDCIPMFME